VLLAVKVAWGLLGFVLGLAIGSVSIEFVHYIAADLYGVYYEPFKRIPPAALIVGVSSAWFGFRRPPNLSAKSSLLQSKYSKLFIAGFLIWSLVVFTLVWGLNLLGRYWNSDNWQKFWVIWLAPPTIALVSFLLFHWAMREAEKTSNDV